MIRQTYNQSQWLMWYHSRASGTLKVPNVSSGRGNVNRLSYSADMGFEKATVSFHVKKMEQMLPTGFLILSFFSNVNAMTAAFSDLTL